MNEQSKYFLKEELLEADPEIVSKSTIKGGFSSPSLEVDFAQYVQ